ncbi:MAG: hypothetical protein H6739_03845 [Alphaproteobacteria bacterium]|nr:hypothetical protein [Alphaproteobacteria bacterium]
MRPLPLLLAALAATSADAQASVSCAATGSNLMEVPSARYPTLGDAMSAAWDGAYVQVDTTSSSWDPSADAYVITRHSLCIVGDPNVSTRAEIPALKIYDGAVVELEHVEIVGEYETTYDWGENATQVVHPTRIRITGAELYVTDAALSPNASGPGIVALDSTVELINVEITGMGDRAIYHVTESDHGALVLQDVQLTDNTGGAVAMYSQPDAQSASLGTGHFDAVTFARNAADVGADLYAEQVYQVDITDSTFESSVATEDGGAIALVDAALQGVNLTFIDLTAGSGAVVHADTDEGFGSFVELEEIVIEGAASLDLGGAFVGLDAGIGLFQVEATDLEASGGSFLYAEGGYIELEDIDIRAFEVGPDGGAIVIEDSEPNYVPYLLRVRVCGNLSPRADAGEGAMLRLVRADAEVLNSVAQGIDGPRSALIDVSDGTLALLNNTFVDNGVPVVVQGSAGSPIYASHNIFMGSDLGLHGVDGFTSLDGDHNLWWDLPDYATGSGVVAVPGYGAVYDDPLFWAPFDPWDCDTHPYLSYASPALDAGVDEVQYRDPPEEPRVSVDTARADIGAYGGPDAPLLDDLDGDSWIVGLDCDDQVAAVHPEQGESWYDGVDADCDGEDDYDADGDGHRPSAYGGGDCEDNLADIHPGAEEVWYDGVDQDCDGASDFDADQDGEDAEGYGGADCDDADAAVHPYAEEIWYDGLDQDCEGGSDFDADADGEDAEGYGGTDCDDTDPQINPVAFDIDGDGVDQNCDGLDGSRDKDADQHEDAAVGGNDCDDNDASVHPGAPEIPGDGVDQDCDGVDPTAISGGGCGGCAAGPPPSGLWLFWALSLALRRRRAAPG